MITPDRRPSISMTNAAQLPIPAVFTIYPAALAEAAIYLSTAPKSNRAALAIWNARGAVRDGALGEVPAHLRDAHYQGASALGHGDGYEYPHDHDGGWVDQQYLPAELADRRWYEPTTIGHEEEIRERMDTRRRSGTNDSSRERS